MYSTKLGYRRLSSTIMSRCLAFVDYWRLVIVIVFGNIAMLSTSSLINAFLTLLSDMLARQIPSTGVRNSLQLANKTSSLSCALYESKAADYGRLVFKKM